MKRILLVAMVCALVVSPAFGQAGSIGLFSDVTGTDCNLYDQQQGLCSFHIVHVMSPGATACQFSAPQPACLQATYLSDTFPIMVVGNTQTGVAIGYGACVSSPIHVGDINYFCQGLTASCCYYPVLPDPNIPSGQIDVMDCNLNLVYATGGVGIINPDESCECDVAVEDSTWGAVKALYME
ncbi:MAG: hypothetical protein JSW58_16265 [Candidatus Latescibacterota bacterium]|nr:MAG: hypothetical protein JSW58_16265 [Candidatus Latescibacterota bacterium]